MIKRILKMINEEDIDKDIESIDECKADSQSNHDNQENESIGNNTLVSNIKRMEDHNNSLNAINPIVFTSIGNLRNPQVFSYPTELYERFNIYNIENADCMLNHLDKYQLELLYNNSLNINRIISDDYIKNESFVSFCSFIDWLNFNEFNGLLSNFRIKETVRDYINKSEIFACLRDNNYLVCVSVADYNNFDDKYQSIISYCRNLGTQISLLIANSICCGIEDAVNDVLLDIHSVPNINKIYDRILELDSPYVKSINDHPEDFNTYCSCAVKSIIRDNLDDLIIGTICPGVTNFLIYSIWNGSFVYKDKATLLKSENNNKL